MIKFYDIFISPHNKLALQIFSINPLTAGPDNIRVFSFFISTLKYHLLSIQCDINQQDFKSLISILSQINFHSHEVVDTLGETQLQVSENTIKEDGG